MVNIFHNLDLHTQLLMTLMYVPQLGWLLCWISKVAFSVCSLALVSIKNGCILLLIILCSECLFLSKSVDQKWITLVDDVSFCSSQFLLVK